MEALGDPMIPVNPRSTMGGHGLQYFQKLHGFLHVMDPTGYNLPQDACCEVNFRVCLTYRFNVGLYEIIFAITDNVT